MERRPLDGVRVIDFCWIWAGPSGTELLAYMGAEVIRVESQARLCSSRREATRRRQPIPGVNQCTIYNALNHNKRSITINLSKPQGKELVKKLIATGDVVTDNFAGGVMDDMGLGYNVLKQIKPDIIQVSMSCFGDYGPFKRGAGYAPIFASLSGWFDLCGYADWAPATTAAGGRVDLTSGLNLAFCVLAALHHKARTGEGQFVDMSSWENMNCVVGDQYMDYFMNKRSPVRMGNHDSQWAPHNCYRCQGDDKWVSIAVTNDKEWQALSKAIGKPELATDKRYADTRSRWRNQDELDVIITQWTSVRTPFEATEILQKAGVAAFPSVNQAEIGSDPHLKERGFFVEVEHPEVGKRTYLAPVWKMSATPAKITKHAPLLGEDNEYVFLELLKLPIEEFATLVGDEVIF